MASRFSRTGLGRWAWPPALAALLVLAAEAALVGGDHLRREPLISVSVPSGNLLSRFGATEVDIGFGKFSRPSTLNVSLLRQQQGFPPVEIDVTEQFMARENGAVGSLSGLQEGHYTVRARVFGHPHGRRDILIEEDATVVLKVPPLPPLDRV
jgi:hypothetical protein